MSPSSRLCWWRIGSMWCFTLLVSSNLGPPRPLPRPRPLGSTVCESFLALPLETETFLSSSKAFLSSTETPLASLSELELVLEELLLSLSESVLRFLCDASESLSPPSAFRFLPTESGMISGSSISASGFSASSKAALIASRSGLLSISSVRQLYILHQRPKHYFKKPLNHCSNNYYDRIWHI